jgi:hypothetical protein
MAVAGVSPGADRGPFNQPADFTLHNFRSGKLHFAGFGSDCWDPAPVAVLLCFQIPHFIFIVSTLGFSLPIQQSESARIGIAKRAKNTIFPGASRRDRPYELHYPGECSWQIKMLHRCRPPWA